MLLGNRSVILRTPGRHFAGATISDNRSNWSIPSSSRTLGMTDQSSGVIGGECAGIPNGYAPPYCWVIPRKSGGLATTNQIISAQTLTLTSLAQGVALSTNRLGTLTMTSLGSISAQTIQRILWIATIIRPLEFSSLGAISGPIEMPSWLAKIVNPFELIAVGDVSGPVYMPSFMSALLENPNDLDDNVLSLFVWLISTIENSHTLDVNTSLLVKMGALLEASGDVDASIFMPALLSATIDSSNEVASAASMLAWCSTVITQTGAVNPADLDCLLWMSALLTSEGAALTAQACAAAVWRAIAVDYLDTGTMGKKLNDAGGSGNPWDTVLDNGLTAGEMMRLVLAMLGGDIEAYDIVKAFNNTSKTRFTFTTDEHGNRTLVSFDPSA